MTAKQLKDILNNIGDTEAEQLNVVIEIRKDSIGPTPAVNLECACIGFDWDMGRFMLTPHTPLMEFAERQCVDTPKPKHIRKKEDITTCQCSTCFAHIDEIDKYCKNCGQKFL